MIEAYFDGCCEPINPGGTAAYGIVIFKDGQEIFEDSKEFPPTHHKTSNNFAEYRGFKALAAYYEPHLRQRERGGCSMGLRPMFGLKIMHSKKKCQEVLDPMGPPFIVKHPRASLRLLPLGIKL